MAVPGRSATADWTLRPMSQRRSGQRPGTDAGPVNKSGSNPTDSGHCAHRRLHHRDRPRAAAPTTSASRASRPGSPPRADPQPGTTRRLMPYQTGRPWRNRHRSTSSTSGCSGSRLPLSARLADAPLPVPVVIVPPESRAKPPGKPARRPPNQRFAPRVSPLSATVGSHFAQAPSQGLP